ncbi:MAG: hypothetical protein R6W06_11280 [Prochlorococcaceae cyanobacterium]
MKSRRQRFRRLAQQREQLRMPLHRIDHHRAAQLAQGRERLIQPGPADRIFQVKRVGGFHRRAGQGRLDRGKQGGPGQHPRIVVFALKNLQQLQIFQGNFPGDVGLWLMGYRQDGLVAIGPWSSSSGSGSPIARS